MAEKKREFVFVSDIHSNLEALRAVLYEVGDRPLYCLGDSVGYGASPNEVVDLLKEKKAVSVLGNHDFASITADPGGFNSRAAVAVVWTSRQLSDVNRRYLAELPRNRTVELAGEKVYMTHGSPDDNLGEYVYPTTHSDMFDFYLRKLSVKAIVLGHTHVPFAWSSRQGVVFNPGSVGQPRDGDRKASYAILSVNGGKVEVEHRRVEYDVEASAKKIIEAGLPASLANRLFTGD